MRGLYAIKVDYPYTPGWEGSGTVVSVGDKSQNGWLGKRVGFMKKGELQYFKVGGAYADYCITNTRSLMPLPDEFSFEQGSSFFVNPLTAIGMVERCVKKKAKACIVTAAAS